MNKSAKWINIIFIVVLASYALLHIGLWSDEPIAIDPVNFSLALEKYDVSIDQPHPPGYPLYVGLGKLASKIVGNPHAYQLINLSMVLFASICLFLLAKSKGYAAVGLAATILLVTHPLTFATTIVQESYFSDALFGCLIITWLLLKAGSFRTQIIGISVIFFALGLFRLVSCAQLGLLAIGCIYLTNHENHPIRKILTAMFWIALSASASYLIIIWLAGGYEIHREATARVMGAAFAKRSMLAGAPIEAHVHMILKLVFWLLVISLPTLLLASYVFLKDKKAALSQTFTKDRLTLLACWALPSLGLFSLFYFHKPTYVIIFIPPILLVFTILLFKAFKQQHAWYLVAALAGAQLVFFFNATSALPMTLYGVSHAFFQKQETTLKGFRAFIAQENSADALLLWQENPSFHIYASRIFDWEGKIARIDSKNEANLPTFKNGQLSVTTFDPSTLYEGKGLDLRNINKVLIIDSNHFKPSYQAYSKAAFLKQFTQQAN